MSQIIYPLTGLHCQACIRRVTEALAPHAKQAQVSLAPMQVTLTDAHADLSTLQAAVRAAGAYTLLAPDVLKEKVLIPVINRAQSATNFIVDSSTEKSAWFSTYYPLLLILAFILGGSLLIQIGLHAGMMAEPMDPLMHYAMGLMALSGHETMRYFMAGFFIVFAFFKLLDIRAFADAYAGYDLLAARWRGWGLVYPFVELALGIAYLSNFYPTLTHWATILVMGFSAIGVIRAVMNKNQIQCACLGTVFKLPMSTVTIVEDVGMVLMAAAMLIAANP